MHIVIQDQANGVTSDVLVPATEGITVGEAWSLFVGGTFSSATAQVEVAPEAAGPWSAPEELTFTAAGAVVADISPRSYLRLVTSGGGAGTEISLWIGNAS